MAYSNSPLVSYTNLSPNVTSPRHNKITRITIHCFVGQVDVKRGCDVFANKSRNASCNYVVAKDGKVGLVANERDRSWCSSSRDNDNRAVTIEVASDVATPYAITDKAYKGLVDLVADICVRNGKTQVLWFGDKEKSLTYEPKDNEVVFTVHRWFAAKACPGEYIFTRLAQIRDEVNARISPSDEKTDNSFKVKVICSTLNIRKSPSVLSAKVGTVNKGEIYTITETNGTWGKLKSGIGWISIKPAYVTKL